MLGRQVAFHRQFAAEAGAGHHAEGILQQQLLLQLRVGEPRQFDGQVNAPGNHLQLQVGPVHAGAAHFQVRGNTVQVRQDQGQDHRLQLLRHVQGETPAVPQRVEGLGRVEAAAQTAEGVLDPRGQLLGQRRRGHAIAFADEQRIVQLGAQARQGVADGRLAEVQHRGCAGQVALLVHHLEDPEQVQVQAAQP